MIFLAEIPIFLPPGLNQSSCLLANLSMNGPERRASIQSFQNSVALYVADHSLPSLKLHCTFTQDRSEAHHVAVKANDIQIHA